MSFLPNFNKPLYQGASVAFPTQARPVYDLASYVKLAGCVFSEVETELDTLFCTMRDQYQARDWRSHDYDLTWIRDLSYPIRGPVPEVLESGRYFVVLGSAASFGARAHRPYAMRLSEELGMPCLNLSRSGVGPEWLYSRYNEEYARWISGASFVVLEATSARSVSNSAFQILPDGTKAKRRGARPGDGLKINREIKDMFLSGKAEMAGELIAESLRNYETLTKQLIDCMPCPVVLLYLSRRDPGEVNRRTLDRKGQKAVMRYLSVHPHYVDRIALRRIGKSVEVLECVTDSGLPSRAINRFTGAPTKWRRLDPMGNVKGDPLEVQTYYPSDEMHKDACDALMTTDVVGRVLKDGPR